MAGSDEGRKTEYKEASYFDVIEIYILTEVLLSTVYIYQNSSNSDLKRVLFVDEN